MQPSSNKTQSKRSCMASVVSTNLEVVRGLIECVYPVKDGGEVTPAARVTEALKKRTVVKKHSDQWSSQAHE